MSDDFRRYPKDNTRQLISYPRFMSLTGEKIFICLDRGVMEIARYLLNTRGSWRTTYVKEYGDIGYIMPTEEEFENITQAIAEGNIDMSSCDDIVEAINNLGQTIAGNQCCSSGQGANGNGTSGTGTNQQNIDPWEPEGPSDFPPDFSDLSEYKSHKCAAAGKFMAGLIDDLNAAGILSLGALTILGIGTLLLAAFITPVPWDDLLVIAGVFAFVAGIQAACTDLATYVYNNQDELLCELYNGNSATESKANAIAWLVDAIESFSYSSPIEQGMITIVNSLVTNDAINRLFENNPLWEAPGFDCSACEPPVTEYAYHVGTELTSHPSNPFDSQPDLVGSCQVVDVYWDVPVNVTVLEYLGTTPGNCVGNPLFNFWLLPEYVETSPDEAASVLPQDVSGGYGPYQRLRVVLNIDTDIRITYTIA